MKVGIITVYDSQNVGSFLQAFALQEFVRANGDEPYMIRTRSEKQAKDIFVGLDKNTIRKNPKVLLRYVKSFVLKHNDIVQREKKFEKYRQDWKKLNIIEIEQANELNLDMVLLGSDEIWNVNVPAFEKDIMYGHGINAVKKYGYAVSAGDAELSDFDGHKALLEHISALDGIFVRDSHTEELLNSAGISVSGKIFDPTLQIKLTDILKSNCEVKSERFILIYSYHIKPQLRDTIKAFAKENHLKTVAVSLYHDWCDEYINCSPLEIGDIFKKAEYVYTSTFHGTVLSLSYHKKVLIGNEKLKVTDLLEKFEMSDRLTDSNCSLEEFSQKICENADYEKFEEKLSQIRKESTEIYIGLKKHDEKAVCDYKKCTGCGACYYSCPVKCIKMSEDRDGNIYPEIDRKKCINCKKCEKVCPQVNKAEKNKSIAAYAAWNTDKETYRMSASGGTASAICEYAVSQGALFAGASVGEKGNVSLNIYDSLDGIKKIQNSKYVFSTAYDVFGEMEKRLKDGKKIFFTGLPCQTAAVKNLFDKKYHEQLFLIDLVCHGIMPYSYLAQHIKKIENNFGKSISTVTFREPSSAEQPCVFAFACYDNGGNKFYSKKTADGDEYQYAYHRAVAYRENCYRCIYAENERCSDITLGDFRAFDRVKKEENYPKKVSSVIVNTERGKALIEKLSKEGLLIVKEREVSEPFKYDRQLSHPSKKTAARYVFEKNMKNTNGDFGSSVEELCKENLKNEKRRLAKSKFKRAVKKILRKK